MIEREQLDRYNDLGYWFPILETIQGLNLPKTEIFEHKGESLINLLDGIRVDGFDDLASKIQKACVKFGLPAFLRTGLTSGKHDWENTCYLEKGDIVSIRDNIYNLVEFSAMADIFGLATDTWVVREYLPVKKNLIAEKYGNMPVTKERRYFINDGKVVHRQPYWPKVAVDEGGPNRDNWEEILRQINHETKDEISILTELSELVGTKFKEYWSVDWLWVNNKWYLTDMARGECSYKYEPLDE